ncbi:MAG: hypothetical protein HYY80_04890 [Chloroflexi bacterium]|nr:hypothetical protein [Chloroflexota bacterium]
MGWSTEPTISDVEAKKEGMISLWHDGMLKVKEGVTTPHEVIRNVFSIG